MIETSAVHTGDDRTPKLGRERDNLHGNYDLGGNGEILSPHFSERCSLHENALKRSFIFAVGANSTFKIQNSKFEKAFVCGEHSSPVEWISNGCNRKAATVYDESESRP